jgi:hypothetical protein
MSSIVCGWYPGRWKRRAETTMRPAVMRVGDAGKRARVDSAGVGECRRCVSGPELKDQVNQQRAVEYAQKDDRPEQRSSMESNAVVDKLQQ